jgi:hypothetical protein
VSVQFVVLILARLTVEQVDGIASQQDHRDTKQNRGQVDTLSVATEHVALACEPDQAELGPLFGREHGIALARVALALITVHLAGPLHDRERLFARLARLRLPTRHTQAGCLRFV